MDANTWVNILDILWPVGSLFYCLEGATGPETTLGGSWVAQGSTLTIGNKTFTPWYRYA